MERTVELPRLEISPTFSFPWTSIVVMPTNDRRSVKASLSSQPVIASNADSVQLPSDPDTGLDRLKSFFSLDTIDGFDAQISNNP